MIMIFVSSESYDKGLLVNRWFKNTSYNPGREILVQNWKNRDSFVGGQNLICLKFRFSTLLYPHYEYCVKIWAKMNVNSLFYSIFSFQRFVQKIRIFDERAIPKWPWFLNASTYNHEILPKCVIYVNLKSKKSFKSVHAWAATVSNKI